MRSFDPESIPTKDLHAILLSTVAPRPIAWASTVDEKGNPNLAPFSFFNVFSSNPPVMIFSPALRVRDNTGKHTLANVLDTGECVINICNYALRDQMAITSAEYEDGVNEFLKAGLTMAPSVKVRPPRVLEAPAQYECRVHDVIKLGDSGGAGNLIVCEVVYVHLNENVFGEDGKIDPVKVDNIARLGYNWYTRANASLFEMDNPKATPEMGFDKLPSHIAESHYLTGSEIARLTKSPYRPTKEEVEMVKESTGMRDIYDKYGRDKVELRAKVHTLAKNLLGDDKVEEAWQVLMSYED
ncbi:MAG: flavin reductase family protein [Bacteroidota bacterium]|nr:flavin reductase family protein [Bacteroidota bacterium]